MLMRKVLVMKPLFAKIVAMILSLPLVRKHFILRRALITPLSAARVARMQRRDEWMVVEEEVVEVEEEGIEVEEEEIEVAEEEVEEFAMLSKEGNATEAVIVDFLMRVAEEVEVEEAVVVEGDVVEEEGEEFVIHFKRENATEVPRVDSLMIRLLIVR